MNKFFAYIRVSTPRQGEHGVSLQEQKDAISGYAKHNNLKIISWFEERQTAAKRGRPGFTLMLRLLKRGKADGVIIHKIDRSARNLKDWADLGEMIDQGIEVYFVNESLDLHSRGGRLSADIQAVVAADFIRNLREETKKGLYGRIKQGLLPGPAPLGYLDKGSGKAKEPDPIKAPFVTKAFELYASCKYNLDSLTKEMFRLGLRNRNGNTVTRTGFSHILNNPFYMGLLHIKRTGETFSGCHKPLISKTLFDRVRDVLTGKANTKTQRHMFTFRRLFACKSCKYSLIGETQKGHTYYRCHTNNCPTTCMRGKDIEKELLKKLLNLQSSSAEKAYIAEKIKQLKKDWWKEKDNHITALNLRMARFQHRFDRLTDAYIDGLIDKEVFENRKTSVLMAKKELEEQMTQLKNGRSVPEILEEKLELAGSAYLKYKLGLFEEKRDLLRIVTSNRIIDRKKVEISLNFPFQQVEERWKTSYGSPQRNIPRTWDRLIKKLMELLKSKGAHENE